MDTIDYRQVKIPDVPYTEFETMQRRAYFYERVTELGHPSLLDKQEQADRFDISRRMVYKDLDRVAESINEYQVKDNHVGNNLPVFEKAKREALRQGDYQEAVGILREQAEWLEDRGELDKEPETHEVNWRHYLESGEEQQSELDELEEIEVEAVEVDDE